MVASSLVVAAVLIDTAVYNRVPILGGCGIRTFEKTKNKKTMEFDLRLQCPFTMMLIGPSSSGKSTLLTNLLAERQQLFTNPPVRTRLYYNVYQHTYDQMLGRGLVDDFVEGMPTREDLQEFLGGHSSTCIIFDDLADQLSDAISELFTVGSHHMNTNVIVLAQNLFQQSQVWRTCSRNTTYMVLMKSSRDPGQIAILNRQMFPQKKNFLPSVCKYYWYI